MLASASLEKPEQQAFHHFFEKNRQSLAIALLDTLKTVPRFKEEIDALGEDVEQYVEEQVSCNVDYIKKWISQDNENFSALYIGEKAKAAFSPGASVEHRREAMLALVKSDGNIIINALKQGSENELAIIFEEKFKTIIDILSQDIEKELKVLFIGDCIHLDIMGFLVGQTAKHKTSVVPEFITQKNPALVNKELSKYEGNQFDIVFYSPFSYEYNSDFSQFLNWKKALFSFFKAKDLVSAIFSDIQPVINALANKFSANVFVHNAAAIIRLENTSAHAIKNVITKPARNKARVLIGKRLESVIEKANKESFFHLNVMDEAHYLSYLSDEALGQFFYKSKLQHPARLGAEISKDYDLICESHAHLFGKKIIVCDLDNTLWDGVIGEGAVVHHAEKQKLLKRIKSKGIVLAIASKNDPANVHWEGGVLNDDDFVYRNIDWNPKIQAFSKMQKELNLKIKDFVFIDDRADERAFAKSTYPEMTILDALDDRSWEMIAKWDSMLDNNGAMDRTKLYQERAERNSFITEADEVSEETMFAALDLKIFVKDAQEEDIKRAAELINRTNQFNICASRTTETEMHNRFNDDRYTILISSMTDKFGDMGVISVLVAEEKEDCIEVLAFVLSCRVFGYAAETVILNRIKAMAQSTGKPIKGRYVETMHNAPCKNVYQENGFEDKGDIWFYTNNDQVIEQPSWFFVSY